jgi:hypothetical protein
MVDEEIGGSGKVEQEIVSELSKLRPIWQPRPSADPAAHRPADERAVRAAAVAAVVVPLAIWFAVLLD